MWQSKMFVSSNTVYNKMASDQNTCTVHLSSQYWLVAGTQGILVPTEYSE